MTPDSVGPLSRPLPLHRVTSAGLDATVEANESERVALAADLDLPAIHRLHARYRVTGSPDRIRVVGRVEASVDRICVVSLDPFTTAVDEDVEVEFAAPVEQPDRDRADPLEIDLSGNPPDELVGDSIDLGSITAEFLALGLDPYPRKPGATMPDEGGSERGPSPFDKLAALRPQGPSRE